LNASRSHAASSRLLLGDGAAPGGSRNVTKNRCLITQRRNEKLSRFRDGEYRPELPWPKKLDLAAENFRSVSA